MILINCRCYGWENEVEGRMPSQSAQLNVLRNSMSNHVTLKNLFIFLSIPSKAIIYIPQKVFNKPPPLIILKGGGGPIITYGGGGGAFF